MAPQSRQMTAACAGLAANLLLGLSALFWKALGALPPTTLLVVRIVASLATLLLLMGALGRLRVLAQSLNRRYLALHLAAAMLVACNWLTFIRASIEGHVVESGLGYLLAPFIAIAAGRLVFGETMSRFRLGALLLIAGCVLLLAWRSQELQHQVYLTIGLSWGAYACIKKLATLDAFGGLLCETVVLALLLPALAWSGALSLAWPPPLPGATWAMLAASGLVSVLPLWLFSLAAARLPITTMGFFQFVLPLTQLLVALLERFRPDWLRRDRGKLAPEQGAAMSRSGATAKSRNAVPGASWPVSTSRSGRKRSDLPAGAVGQQRSVLWHDLHGAAGHPVRAGNGAGFCIYTDEQA